MKFEYLREFVTAAESTELQQAARELNISASVLSKHIKVLEQELDVPLFKRSRKAELSPFGTLLLPYAQELVALQDEYLLDFSGSADRWKRELAIGMSPIQIRERSGQLIDQYALTRSGANIRVVEAGNSKLISLLKEGQCDLIFMRTQSEQERDPELVYVPFCADRMVAFLPPDHPLAGEKSVSLLQLKDDTILLRGSNTPIYRMICSLCESLDFTPNISLCGSYVTYDMVRRGAGITFYFSAPAAADYDTPLAIVPVEPPVISYLDIIFRRGQLSKAATDFIRHAQERMLSDNSMPASDE